MLFDAVFDMDPRIAKSVEPYVVEHDDAGANDGMVTIGVHMRHKNGQDDGHDVHKYVTCLDQMLEFYPTQPCTVYIASDRPRAVAAFAREARNRNCTAVFVNHDAEARDMDHLKNELSDDKEHGVFAGLPYFKDLHLLSHQSRSGLIHSGGNSWTGSSASALIWQQLVYNGIQDGSFSYPPMDCSPTLKRVRFHGPTP